MAKAYVDFPVVLCYKNDILLGGNRNMENLLIKISIMLVPGLFAITLHEVSHGYAAERFGDPTARMLGRLSLNPLKHLDPVGTLVLLIVGFGWARPVPVNFGNLRKPRQDMIFVALSGPLTNFSLAVVSALILRGIPVLQGILPDGGGSFAVLEPLSLMAGFSLYINIILGVFNLLPVPPLDGGRVMMGVLPPKSAGLLSRVEPFGFFLIIFLIFFTDLWQIVMAPTVAFFVGLLAGPQVLVVERAIHFLFAR